METTPKIITIVMYNDGYIHYVSSSDNSNDENVYMLQEVLAVMKHEETN